MLEIEQPQSADLTSKPYKSYIPNTHTQQEHMMDAIGIEEVNALFHDLPVELLDPHLDLPQPMTELELTEEMQKLAAKNIIMPSFLGAGAYRRFIPAVVGDLAGRDEYLTSYTPYQPEIAQGTLTTAFEFQTAMCNLYKMDVSNTGMYDGATALAEATLKALRIKNSPDRDRIVALDTVHPNWLEVTNTYLSGKGKKLDIVDESQLLDGLENTAAVIVQSPNYFGNLEKIKSIGEAVHDKGALFIVASDPVSLGMLTSPGEAGADIAVGEGQSLGNPLHMGGVNLGIFTSKMEYLRNMPGRIVGQAKDVDGKTGYVLALVTREQFARREKATSNICTAEQLIALRSTIYLSILGSQGLHKIAHLNYQNAHHLAKLVTTISGYELAFPDKSFFNEFVVTCPAKPSHINRHLLGEGIIGGMDVSNKVPNGMLLCATEMTTLAHMNQLVAALSQ